MNCEAFGRMKELVIKSEGKSEYISWELLNMPVCRRSWKTLHNMGISISKLDVRSHTFIEF